MSDSKYFQRVSAEVRAAMAREHRGAAELAGIIGRTVNTARDRMAGRAAFSLDDLEAISEWLDIPLGSLVLPPAIAPASELAG